MPSPPNSPEATSQAFDTTQHAATASEPKPAKPLQNKPQMSQGDALFLVLPRGHAPVKSFGHTTQEDAMQAAEALALNNREEVHVYTRALIYRPKPAQIERIIEPQPTPEPYDVTD